jgi:hypothetical protein
MKLTSRMKARKTKITQTTLRTTTRLLKASLMHLKLFKTRVMKLCHIKFKWFWSIKKRNKNKY